MKLIASLMILVSSTVSYCQTYKQSLSIHIPFAPQRFKMDNKHYVCYELHITNFSLQKVKLQEIVVSVRDSKTTFFKGDADELSKRFQKVGTHVKDSVLVMKPGGSGVLYLEIEVPEIKDAFVLQHQISLSLYAESGDEKEVINGIELEVPKEKAISIGPPLKGGLWTAIHHPSWERGHRRVIYTLGGKARIPGRYAIDFVKVNDEGLTTSGEADHVDSWLGYGAEVLAVADGVVSSVNKSFPEVDKLSEHPAYGATKATGNYVSIKIGKGVYAFYEHLKPNSISVKAGQKVKKGDMIALLGFTGQTTNPHLHFHMASNDSPLGAEGIPYVFDSFNHVGVYDELDNLGKKKWISNSNSNSLRREERPVPNSVVEFK
ncbi:M23 family metallopeptidase [Chryseosolibacter indicus]|uniref:M23 family metallopeptidase n=1 Tax=Chryseosolibacter indicus TaxID=2782351 RepID=A0ABS5VX40_9BACT|nr:M23 family metallopeptidase [Chryseosolibacter indicus]MBT1705891.1 M23 family metallopeptidase [Chryseosolibacter indicus]